MHARVERPGGGAARGEGRGASAGDVAGRIMPVKLYTIGFTRTSAAGFFGRLQASAVRRIIDVRLNNVSQLAGFAKRDDLAYFSAEICGIGYEHRVDLAPSASMLARFRNTGDWHAYEAEFLSLLSERGVASMSPETLDGACLLCSEASPHHCHRRLVAEYLRNHWCDIDIVHL